MFIVYIVCYTVEQQLEQLKLVADSPVIFNGWTNNNTDYDYDEFIDSLNQYINSNQQFESASDDAASTSVLEMELIVLSCICYIALVVVVIVGFVLLRRKVSNNRFSELK